MRWAYISWKEPEALSVDVHCKLLFKCNIKVWHSVLYASFVARSGTSPVCGCGPQCTTATGCQVGPSRHQCTLSSLSADPTRAIYNYTAPPLKEFVLPPYLTEIGRQAWCAKATTGWVASTDEQPGGCIPACQQKMGIDPTVPVKFVFNFDMTATDGLHCVCALTCGTLRYDQAANLRAYSYDPPGEGPSHQCFRMVAAMMYKHSINTSCHERQSLGHCTSAHCKAAQLVALQP